MEPIFVCPHCYYATIPEGGPLTRCPACGRPVNNSAVKSAFNDKLLKMPTHVAGLHVFWGLLLVVTFTFIAIFAGLLMDSRETRLESDLENMRASGSTHTWEMSGNNPARTGYTDAPPLKAHDNIWGRSRFGKITTDCVVTDRSVIFGTEDGNLYAVSRTKGRIIWNLDIGKSIKTPPLIHGPYLFATSTDGKLACRTLYGAFEVFKDKTLSPVVSMLGFGKALYAITADGRILVFSLSEGNMIKRIDDIILNAKCLSQAAMSCAMIVISTVEGELIVYDIERRAIRWRAFPGPKNTQLGRPCIENERIFVASRSGALYALALSDGKPAWQAKFNGCSVPLAAHDARVIAHGDDGKINCFRWLNGRLEWSRPGNGVSGVGPVIHGNRVYCGSASGAVMCFALDDGKVQWQSAVARGKSVALATVDGILFTCATEGSVGAIGR